MVRRATIEVTIVDTARLGTMTGESVPRTLPEVLVSTACNWDTGEEIRVVLFIRDDLRVPAPL